MIKQIKENDSEFEQKHLEVLNFVTEQDEDTLQQEETVFDEHVNQVTELIKRLEHIKASGRASSSSISTMIPDHSSNLEKRLKVLVQQRETIAASMLSPPAGTKSHPKLWLQECQKDIDVLTSQLTGVMGETLHYQEVIQHC